MFQKSTTLDDGDMVHYLRREPTSPAKRLGANLANKKLNISRTKRLRLMAARQLGKTESAGD